MAEAHVNSRRAVLAGLGGLGLIGCSPSRPPAGLAFAPRFDTPRLPALRLSADRITRITVCLRPFRHQGPRLEAETVGAKRVVHNYGHGGSGWSLSWGSAAIAARMALESGAKEVAVIGCGAIGLTTALTLQRAGARVAIYAKERLPETRSARATGTWSPDSRVADADKVDAGFPARWSEMAHVSYAKFQTYLGMPGDPVAWTDRYYLRDRPPTAAATPSAPEAGVIRFTAYERDHPDLSPRSIELKAEENPFPVAYARRATLMQFNVAELGHLIMTDFLLEGGRIVPMTFNSPADLAQLKEPVVVNCTGYGARALWGDESVVPVRGQITWLSPQPEVRYGFYYHGVSVLPRPDGIVVQQTGSNDMWGYNDPSETPDRSEGEAAIATVAPLFAQPAPRPVKA
jgi:glycine/D-amino acid oxidase-like deaminating enzyme